MLSPGLSLPRVYFTRILMGTPPECLGNDQLKLSKLIPFPGGFTVLVYSKNCQDRSGPFRKHEIRFGEVEFDSDQIQIFLLTHTPPSIVCHFHPFAVTPHPCPSSHVTPAPACAPSCCLGHVILPLRLPGRAFSDFTVRADDLGVLFSCRP